ncbi:hypothetical protein MMYC01_204202 [Madurella mycetomatis]|uniref:Uncharacterized protein n=1 Tax=Madurella mycetomatis TaxID=100816 RepID=A0A175W335_9PEZI|nr:hypothetical protein MMYC01_210577 [Madurella mycetomatis]KXX78086.1 hypothetical protein MMYC01_204202 [Madurella mycetomatis]
MSSPVGAFPGEEGDDHDRPQMSELRGAEATPQKAASHLIAEKARNLHRTARETMMPPPPSVASRGSSPSRKTTATPLYPILPQPTTRFRNTETFDLLDPSESDANAHLSTTEEPIQARPKRLGNNKEITEWLDQRIRVQNCGTTKKFTEVVTAMEKQAAVLTSLNHTISVDINRHLGDITKHLDGIRQQLTRLETDRQDSPTNPDILRDAQDRLHDLGREPQNRGYHELHPLHRQRSETLLPPSPNRQTYRQFYREGAFETSTESNSRPSSAVKIKREDIGQFNPHYHDPDDLGVVTDGKSVIYTDVHYFLGRIGTFLENPDTRLDMERQITQLLPTLLGGNAVLWWTNELTPDRRNLLRCIGLRSILEDLRARFGIDPGTATRRFNQVYLANASSCPLDGHPQSQQQQLGGHNDEYLGQP